MRHLTEYWSTATSMRVFSAALATETNTFAPMPTGLSSFHERAYYPAGEHPDAMQMHGGPLWAAPLGLAPHQGGAFPDLLDAKILSDRSNP
jgi:hypothetical protein